MLEIRLETSLPPTEPDRRYRVMVLLQRSDRPVYTKFHCPRCLWPLAELINREVVALSDAMNIDNTDLGVVGLRCDGMYDTGARCEGHKLKDGNWCDSGHPIRESCRTWYYFTLGYK